MNSNSVIAVASGIVILAGMYLLLGGAAKTGKKAAKYGMKIFMPFNLVFFGIPAAVFVGLGALKIPATLTISLLSCLLWIIPAVNIFGRMGADGMGLFFIQLLAGLGLGATVLGAVVAIVAGIAGIGAGKASIESDIQRIIAEERRENERNGIDGPGEFERKYNAMKELDD